VVCRWEGWKSPKVGRVGKVGRVREGTWASGLSGGQASLPVEEMEENGILGIEDYQSGIPIDS
jgi:hypothetical protein